MRSTVCQVVVVTVLVVVASDAYAEGSPALQPQPILDQALALSAEMALAQSGSNAREIESKRTMGLVKIIIGGLCAVSGISWLTTGEAKYMVVGAGLGGGGAWLIYDGVQDRADAAELEASGSLNFAPMLAGGGRAW